MLIVACNDKRTPTKEQSNEFAIAIHTSTCCGIKADQQNFVNKFVVAIKQFHDDKNADIDIKELKNLLHKAQQANRMSLDALNELQEIDEEINLKKYALAQVNSDKSLFEMMGGVIDAIEKKDYEKVTEMITSFSQMEEEIKGIRKVAQDADTKFSEKYRILPFIDDSPKKNKPAPNSWFT